MTAQPNRRSLFNRREIIIKDTHRGLWYENGVLVRTLGAGRYVIPLRWLTPWQPKVEVVLVDMRERDLTIKGQEILTSDKVAIRVSIVVQFRVADPQAALHRVENYEDRLYTDVQLAARRSLASMTLEDILTNRNRLSEDILHDVKDAASGYGVTILRADVKDLIFPGNLQDVMNRVLQAERLSQAQLVEARTRANAQRIETEAQLETQRAQVEANAEEERLRIRLAEEARREAAQTEADIQQIKTAAEIRDLRERQQAAAAYTEHPALLRLAELETLREMARNSNARLYIRFDKLPDDDAEQ
jgi:regulator of protease activity HflC (stomatin/prohibitin superfamily)